MITAVHMVDGQCFIADEFTSVAHFWELVGDKYAIGIADEDGSGTISICVDKIVAVHHIPLPVSATPLPDNAVKFERKQNVKCNKPKGL